VQFVERKLCPTVCVTCAGADGDSVWEQEKLEARKMLAVGAAESAASSAPSENEYILFHQRNRSAMGVYCQMADT
jgi:hypothetical protein